jgi:SAM-dependent methyltransferase
MLPLLYRDLLPWYRLIDPPHDHLDEANSYRVALEGAASGRAETLLELGAGAGHNAFHLKQRFRCTLSDVSQGMLGLSRELNPECEHVVGDMRSLRLGRAFDVILVHDAVMYMTSIQQLLEAATTAFEHTRPGGAAIFAPDCVRESFREAAVHNAEQQGDRAVQYIEWSWDPDPADETVCVDYAFLLREAGTVKAVHDQHIEGLFSRAVWHRVLEQVGYRVSMVERPLDHETFDEVFLCRRP